MDIEQALEAFRILLTEQQNRVANMNTEKTDFSTKECVSIGVVDGDCGTKRKIAQKMREFSSKYKSVNFVGGHPMAGKEVSGIENACANLFVGASMIFVPVRIESDELQKLKELLFLKHLQ